MKIKAVMPCESVLQDFEGAMTLYKMREGLGVYSLPFVASPLCVVALLEFDGADRGRSTTIHMVLRDPEAQIIEESDVLLNVPTDFRCTQTQNYQAWVIQSKVLNVLGEYQFEASLQGQKPETASFVVFPVVHQ